MEVLSVLQCGLLSRSLLDSELQTKVRKGTKDFLRVLLRELNKKILDISKITSLVTIILIS